MDPVQIILGILITVATGSVGFIVHNLSNKIETFTKSLEAVVKALAETREEIQKDFVTKVDYKNDDVITREFRTEVRLRLTFLERYLKTTSNEL